jgi:HemY protein
MLRILFLFLIIIAAIIIGPILVGHQGRIVIEVAGYSIKTSVTSFAIMAAIVLSVLATVFWFLKRLLKAGSVTKNWFFDSKQDRAERMTQAAMLKLIEGDYERAERLLANSAKDAAQPMVNYLLAAESAQRRNDLINTNQYLESAAEQAGQNQVPVDITRIRIQLAHGAFDAARAGVDKLLNSHPRHPEVLRLAQKAYLSSGAYQSLLELLPVLRKTETYDSEELERIQSQAYLGMMQSEIDAEGVDGLKRWWSNLPRKTRGSSELKAAVAGKFIELQDHQSAEDIILEGLKQEYNESLIVLLPKLNSNRLEVLEQTLWKLIKKHGATPLLNSTLAQLMIQHGDWQKASEQLRQALEQHPNPQDYALLADTYDHLAQDEDANRIRREALQLTLNSDAEPPSQTPLN